jgi:hypothetical protein
MDPSAIAAIATSAVSLLAPYLKQMADGIVAGAGKRIGEDGWRTATSLYESIRQKLAGDARESTVLKALERTPNDSDTQAAVRFELKRVMAEDLNFAKQLAVLLKEADEAGADTIFQTTIHGNVEKLVQMGNVYGPVRI